MYKDLSKAEKQLETELGVSICMQGCGKCCQVATPFAYRLEALFSVSVASGAGILDKVINLSEGWLLEKHNVTPTYEGFKFGFLEPKVRDEFYALGRSECPFLLDKGCLIHLGRPLVCRAYGVTHMPGPDVNFCPRPLGKGEDITKRGWVDVENLKSTFLSIVGSCEADYRICGLLPSHIFKLTRPKLWKAYIADNKIASAKLVGLQDQYIGLVTQEQMDKQYA
jgi:Fe-S-cluster containining protein